MNVKIAHITTVHYRYDVRIHYKYCKTLSKEKCFDVIQVVADGKGDQQINNLEVLDLGNIKFGRLGRIIIGNLKVLSFSLKNKMDLMHFHDPELMPAMVLLRLTGKKLIFDMHENLPLQLLTKTYMPKILRNILSKLVGISQRTVFHFIAVIFAELSYSKHFTKIKQQETVLNYPLKAEFESITENKRTRFTLGYMGSVAVERGALVMLQSIKRLREKGEEINIIFVGPIDDDLESLPIYKQAVKQGWATFKGRKKPIEGWCIMAQCHIGMAVLQDSPNFIESYPTKLFEYMLLKLPIITSNFPLYKAIIDDAQCGYAVEPSSIKKICNAILDIKNNTAKMKTMGTKGYERALVKYSWESTELEKTKFFYKKILQ